MAQTQRLYLEQLQRAVRIQQLELQCLLEQLVDHILQLERQCLLEQLADHILQLVVGMDELQQLWVTVGFLVRVVVEGIHLVVAHIRWTVQLVLVHRVEVDRILERELVEDMGKVLFLARHSLLLVATNVKHHVVEWNGLVQIMRSQQITIPTKVSSQENEKNINCLLHICTLMETVTLTIFTLVYSTQFSCLFI